MASRQNRYLPVQNGLKSFWLKEPHELSDHRTTPSIPEQSDIVIIGAGYAGVATAYHLLKESTGAAAINITILEARGACSGATGRNGGHCRPDLYGHIPKYIDRAGVRAGAEVAEFEIENMWAIKKAIEDEKIDCDFTLVRCIDTYCNPQDAANAKASYDKLVGLELDYMKDVFFTADPKQAENVSVPLGPSTMYWRRSLTPSSVLRGQGSAGCGILHSRHDVSLQVYSWSAQDSDSDRESERANAYTSTLCSA